MVFIFISFCKVSLNTVRRPSNSQRGDETVTESRSEHFWFGIHSKEQKERPKASRNEQEERKHKAGLEFTVGKVQNSWTKGLMRKVLHTDAACSSPGGGAAMESSACSSVGLLLLVKSDSRLARGAPAGPT